MRFLIGIITGAALTLFIATAVDAPTHPTLDRAKTQLERLWDGLIDTTSDSLFKAKGNNPARTESAPESVEPPTVNPHVPATALAAPQQLPPPPPVKPVSVETAETAATQADERAEHPSPETGGDIDPVAQVSMDPALLLAAVWVPFHSQMSAQGFANRLSRELDHNFRVEKHGAGAYQVVFDATSVNERETVLAQIAEITGQ